MPALPLARMRKRACLLFYDSRGDMQANVVVDQAIRSALNSEFSVTWISEANTSKCRRSHKVGLPVAVVLASPQIREESTSMWSCAVGANALRFVREYDQDLFHGAQIVYWGRKTCVWMVGVRSAHHRASWRRRWTTQVSGAVQFIDTLQPDLEQLIVVSGASDVDRDFEDAARQELRPFEDQNHHNLPRGTLIGEFAKASG